MKKDCKINKKINKIPQVKIVHSIWLLLQWSWKIGVVPKVKYLYKYIDSCTKMKQKIITKNHYQQFFNDEFFSGLNNEDWENRMGKDYEISLT